MITESFINSCFSVIFSSDSVIKKDKSLYRDVIEILNFYSNKETINIPLNIKRKYECLRKVCKMKLSDKDNNNIIDSIVASEKFKVLHDYLETKRFEKHTPEEINDHIKQIRLRKKLSGLFSNYDELSSFLEVIRDGTFDSIDDVINDYENIVKTMYSNMMEINRCSSIEASSSLDLEKDDYDHVIEMIKKKYERSNATKTGYPVLDNEVFNGGFEPSRLYLFAGGSGSGKSTLLNNFILNAAIKEDFELGKEKEKNNDKKKVFVYVTMENTIEESLLRLYQSLTNKSIVQVLRDLKNIDMKKELMSELTKNNATIIMKYFPSNSISPIDLMMVIDDIYSEYEKGSIKGLYIDYVDLLRSDVKKELYRLELSHITMALKNIAVKYNIPVISISQLGRGVYRINDANSLNLDQMSESIKKVEHADAIALMQLDPMDSSIVNMKIGKNRSGKSNLSLQFKVNFEHFKFISGSLISNKKKQTSLDSGFDDGFGGFPTM